MDFARAILAALIAISIALLPTAGGAAASKIAVKMSITNQMDMPCCPNPNNGNGTVTCAFKCCNMVATMFPAPLALLLAVDGPLASFAEGTLRGHITSPAHPPPI